MLILTPPRRMTPQDDMPETAMNDITLQQIEIFLTVAEQLSLTEAAKDLFLNQSAVSRWIQRLETSLNTKLFNRTNRGVALTDHGEFLYTELKPLYEKLGTTLQTLRGMYDFRENILHIGCVNSSEVIGALKEAIRDFQKNYPDILLKIELFEFPAIREELLCGDLDCIVTYSLGIGEYWNVRTKKFKRLETYIAVSAKSKLADSAAIPVEGLKKRAVVSALYSRDEGRRKQAIEICRNIGFIPREIRYMPTYFALELAVKNGRGFNICGVNMLDHFGADIKLYHVKEPAQEQYVMLTWRESSCSDLARAFIASIKQIEVPGRIFPSTA
jgi:DNA-binding transcriptional LysR family regulator